MSSLLFTWWLTLRNTTCTCQQTNAQNKCWRSIACLQNQAAPHIPGQGGPLFLCPLCVLFCRNASKSWDWTYHTSYSFSCGSWMVQESGHRVAQLGSCRGDPPVFATYGNSSQIKKKKKKRETQTLQVSHRCALESPEMWMLFSL